MKIDFLDETARKKVVRTTLYGDQEFSLWELEILHTPVVQRLYHLKQLGFADKVFPDAVHSRFNHILGVAEMAERMMVRLHTWLTAHGKERFDFANELTASTAEQWKVESVDGAWLAAHVTKHIPVIRLVALLHDLTHSAFGHTLEDEVRVFAERHDDPARQKRFFDALTAQLMHHWAVEICGQSLSPDYLDQLTHLQVDDSVVVGLTRVLKEQLDEPTVVSLIRHLRMLESACSLLRHLEYLHEEADKRNRNHTPTFPDLLVTKVLRELDPEISPPDICLHRDAFFIDIVSNTICADLMDYARRDPRHAGLRVQFDERVIRYLCLVSVKHSLSPTDKPCIRLAIQFFTNKMRFDVLSEMSGILKARYLINERVIFHPTKCAAGAMLGTAVQLLGITSLPPWMQVLGDQDFLRVLMEVALRMQEAVTEAISNEKFQVSSWGPRDRLAELVGLCLKALRTERSAKYMPEAPDRISAARKLLGQLASRRYAKPTYRLASGQRIGVDSNDETIADKYSNPIERFHLEREIEHTVGLPTGSLVIHCPRGKGALKIAEALVVGVDLSKVHKLREVSGLVGEVLKPYNDEITAVERMYQTIWQFNAFLDPAQFSKRAVVADIFFKKLHFVNDSLLAHDADHQPPNEFDLLVGEEFQGTYAPEHLREIVALLDSEGARMRYGEETDAIRERTRQIIQRVQADAAKRLAGEFGSDDIERRPRKKKSQLTETEKAVTDSTADHDVPASPKEMNISRRGARRRGAPKTQGSIFENPEDK